MDLSAAPAGQAWAAADGKRLKRLEADPVASIVVRWIFTQFLSGRGIFDIAEELTKEGIPSPSATDPDRNRHRCQIAWSKFAVRTILINPRYTGRQVWNKQRKDEVLIDVDDVALGHTTKMRWNDRDTWVWSEHQVHEALISVEDFELAQETLASRGRGPAVHRSHPTPRPYALRGVLFCGYCGRKMQGNWNNNQPYYRCRFPQEYALANKLDHPKVVYLREAEILQYVDEWLATLFNPARIGATIAPLAQTAPDSAACGLAELRKKIGECDRKLRQYRAALDAGADPVEVSGWINAVKQERARAEGELRSSPKQSPVSEEEIADLLTGLGDLVRVVIEADPADKADLYKQLGLQLTFLPAEHLVQARVIPDSRAGRRPMAEIRGDVFPGVGSISTDLQLKDPD